MDYNYIIEQKFVKFNDKVPYSLANFQLFCDDFCYRFYSLLFLV